MTHNQKIILFGKTGQLGQILSTVLAPLGTLITFDRQDANFLYPEQIHALLSRHKPTIIVNAAAFTAVEQAEKDPTTAFTINAETVSVLANYAYATGACLIHYSTDYVFDGIKTAAYLETDTPQPINIYGHTKYQGEQYIMHSGCKGVILRTSWVYAYHGNNFLRTILHLAQEKTSLQVVDDQIGSPTSVDLLANVTAQIIQRNINHRTAIPPGLYHLTASEETSWHQYAVFFLRELQQYGFHYLLQPEQIQPINSEAYPALAKRPKNSCLNTSKLERTLDRRFPSWHSGVQSWIKQFIKDVSHGNHTPNHPRHIIT